MDNKCLTIQSDNCSQTIVNKNFESQYIKNKNFNNAYFSKCNFSKTMFLNCDFTGSIFISCNFTDATLVGVNFADCTFSSCTFTNAELHTTNFDEKCTFTGCDVTNCNQTNVVGFECGTIITEKSEPISKLISAVDVNKKIIKNGEGCYISSGKYFDLVIADDSAEYGDNTWRVMLIFNDEGKTTQEFLSDIFNTNDMSPDEFQGYLTTFLAFGERKAKSIYHIDDKIFTEISNLI